jgi:hypothetical protein
VGGGPQGLRLADERVKLAARSAETIVDLIIVIVSQLGDFENRRFSREASQLGQQETTECLMRPR